MMRIHTPEAPTPESANPRAYVDALFEQQYGVSYSALVEEGEMEINGALKSLNRQERTPKLAVERVGAVYGLRPVKEFTCSDEAWHFNMRQASSVAFTQSDVNEEGWVLADDGRIYRQQHDAIQCIEVAQHKGVWGWVVSEAPACGEPLGPMSEQPVAAPQDAEFTKIAWTLDLEDSLAMDVKLAHSSAPTL